MSQDAGVNVVINQSVAILVDGNNIERSIHSATNKPNTMLNFDTLVPKLLGNRGLNRLVYFREGRQISSKLRERLHSNYHGSVRPCHKSADIPLSIKATQLASKVDTIIIMSGDSDYVELVSHLKSEGVRVEIAAVPATTSKLLIDEADYFHEITQEDWFTLEPKKSVQKKSSRSRT
ncbi:MAG: NYN domain-containing protein [Gammaproteobacteria bacterium]|nr:NYN domain-containing protein [Gammaproteobacteria bacterium]